ncbi:ribbon-helix-helix protein, CopG family [Oscillatoria sp. FACHB-1406]|uniref:ribbon-helix-helix protein, CopG family n=1 Tax=Oscillatoria sp. FACHB-1406 TaxID=2692846 RepID=UPI0024114ED7|nr:ribbon-helix-helix protein, CopG family [Oscillatoria sp. FACHB-1406]
MKDKKLEIRITSYKMRQLEQEARRRGITKSELIRSLIARFPIPVSSGKSTYIPTAIHLNADLSKGSA